MLGRHLKSSTNVAHRARADCRNSHTDMYGYLNTDANILRISIDFLTQ